MNSRAGPIEVALSTDLRGSPYSFSLWDIHTGAHLVTFKDNLLQVWSIYNRKCQETKLFLPGRPSALAVSPCENYLAVGIAEMIYVWQIRSGNLLAHTQRHYQTITVLKFNQDGAFLFSGAEDGMVLVWPFADLISGTHHTGALRQGQSRSDIGVNEPRFTFQHHNGKITDIHISNAGLCITTSIDKSINIYSYPNGRRLYCISDFQTPIWSVIMNKSGTRLFLGGQDGNIYEFAISSLSISLMVSGDLDGGREKKPLFTGHKDRVDHLLLSHDGSILISGSHDSTCKVWDVPTRKMLRDIKHQAPLANLVTILVPDAFSLTSMTQTEVKPPLYFKPLKREYYKSNRKNSVSKSNLFEEAATTLVSIKNKVDMFHREEQENESEIKCLRSKDQSELKQVRESSIRGSDNDISVRKLKCRLRELYLLSVEKVFKDSVSESLQNYAQMVKQIDHEIPRETKVRSRKSITQTGKISKKVVQTNDATEQPKRKKTELKPRTNGMKKFKETHDLFVD